ncbi:mechanosensitive ion channel family protein [Hoeflea sp. TYP-13]|uniref:mechanosensitive ion channel family protein n=1 Tax=Hoeflea sp. TYP-13 TaxID=3230023 RepID=UPI0034C69B39
MKSALFVFRPFLLAIAVVISVGTVQSLAQAGLTSVTGGAEEESAGTGAVTLPEDLTPETIRHLVSTLSDEQVRQLLLQRLDAVARQDATEQDADADPLDYIINLFVSVGVSFKNSALGLPQVFSGLKHSITEFVEPRGIGGVLWMFAMMGVAIIIGLAVELIVTRFARKWREQIENTKAPENLRETLEILGKRLVLELGGLFAFFVVTRIFIEILVPVNDRPIMPLLMVNLVVLPRISIAITRFLFAPSRPSLRLVHTDDWTARFIFNQQLGLVILIGFSNVVIEFQNMHGISYAESKIGFWLSIASLTWLFYILYRARDGLTSILIGAGDDATLLERLMAKAYPWIAIAAIFATWLVFEMIVAQGRIDLVDDGEGYITVIILLIAPVIDTMVRALVKHLVPPMRGEGALAEVAYRSTKRSYVRIGRALVTVVTIMVIAEVWDIDFSNLASAGLGARIAASMFEILFILAAGYLVWELVSLWLNRKLADEQTAAGLDLESEEPGGGEGGGVGGTRLSTVLPLVKMAAQVSIITITVLIALGHMGVDITPLVAGAGIVGLAIGFGAQTLVKDIMSGLFFLVDDAFRVGEYLEIDGTVGTVEKISVRSLQLRHHQGPVHTIPYGEIPKVTNNSRDWVIVKLKFTVPFDTDVNKVKKLFKQIGKDIMEAPYAEDIIQTFKSQGVYDVNDVGIVVRGKFMAKPGKQWMIRKDVYARVQKIFAENGIEFARREVRVKMPEAEEGAENGDTSQAAAAASQAAIEQQLLEEGAGGKSG